MGHRRRAWPIRFRVGKKEKGLGQENGNARPCKGMTISGQEALKG
jgi:hypothetical protein